MSDKKTEYDKGFENGYREAIISSREPIKKRINELIERKHKAMDELKAEKNKIREIEVIIIEQRIQELTQLLLNGERK